MNCSNRFHKSLIASAKYNYCIYDMILWIILSLLVIDRVCSDGLFDAAGRLSQVELANKAVAKGSLLLSARSNELVVTCSIDKIGRSSSVIGYPPKVRKIADTLAIAATGVVSDVNHLTNKIFEEYVEHENLYGKPQPLKTVASNLATYVHERTLTSYYRPFGVSMVVFGEDDNGGTRLFEIDPMGNCHTCTMCCAGNVTFYFFSSPYNVFVYKYATF